LGAAASHSVYWLIGFSIPVLAFASLAKSWTELVVAGFSNFLAVCGVGKLGLKGAAPPQIYPTTRTTNGRRTEAVRFSIVLLGSVVVLAVQYFRRRTMFARWLAAGVALLCLLTQFFPWRPAFALQQRLSSEPGAGNPINISFDPTLGKYRNPSGLSA